MNVLSIGQRFDFWTVVAPPICVKGRALVECRCDCGTQRVIRVDGLTSLRSHSCGCHKARTARALRTSHGLSNSPTYYSWQSAKDRCTNPNNPHFANYGGRGITMCAEWLGDFAAFLRDMGARPNGLSIDRIDNDGPYGPQNCRWATRAEQSRNHRRNVRIPLDGESTVATDVAASLGLSLGAVRGRMRRGFGPSDLVNPKRYRPRGEILTFNGESLGYAEWSRRTGLSRTAIVSRIRRLGWTIERALTVPVGAPRKTGARSIPG